MKTVMSILTMAALLAVVASAGMFGSVSAHEHRDVGDEGQFSFVVGFYNEPAFQGELNGISVRIELHDPAATPVAEGEEEATTPVEGLEETLTFEIIYEDQTASLPVDTVFRDPGHYVAYVIPTEPGVYSFHITGEIDGVAIDETFTAGPETFSEVAPRAEIEFPATAE